jgi:hypothetical protein
MCETSTVNLANLVFLGASNAKILSLFDRAHKEIPRYIACQVSADPTTNQQPTTNPPIISVPLDAIMIMKGVPNWHSTSLGYKEGDFESGTPKEVK